MERTLLIGTGNPTKFSFYQKYLASVPWNLVSANQWGLTEPTEYGATLEENARLKALYYRALVAVPVIADDAGFEIPALANFPGVRANRLGGEVRLSDQEIIDGILERMRDLPPAKRAARMKIVVALALSDERVYCADGSIEGIVPERAYQKRRKNFPYRSLLYVSALSKWFEDMTEQEEVSAGYRAAAVKKLIPYLLEYA